MCNETCVKNSNQKCGSFPISEYFSLYDVGDFFNIQTHKSPGKFNLEEMTNRAIVFF
jgi:hypothetical protein